MTSSSQRYEEPRWGRHRLPRRRLGAGLLAAVVLAIGGGVTVAAFGSEPAPAHADALCDQMRAQYGSNWPCISVPTNTFQPTTNTPAPTTGANGAGSGGPQVGSNIGPGPGEGNGTPIVTVPGQAAPQPPTGGGNGDPGPTNPNTGGVGPTAPQPVPPGDNPGQIPVVPSTAVPAVTTVPGAESANPEPGTPPHVLDSGSKQPDIPLAAWVVAGAAAFAAANPRVRRAASAGGFRSWSLLRRGGSERATVGPSQLVLINDPTSPKSYVFHEDVPPGGHIGVNPDGSATIYDATGKPVSQIAKPWAFDAAGRPQKTWYTVDENGDLVQHVEPAPNALYPIIADPTEGSPAAARQADEASMAAYNQEFGTATAPSDAANFRAADEASMGAYNNEMGATAPAGAAAFRQADEQSMAQANTETGSGTDTASPVSTATTDSRLPEGVSAPEPGQTVSWTDGNGSQRSYTVNEFGQKVWTTTQSDGTVITVTEGGGSDGADRPWTRTEITHPGGASSSDYNTDGVTGYTYTDQYGVQHRLTQYPDGDVAEQTLQGGDEGSHPPEWTTTRWSNDGSVFVTSDSSTGARSQFDRIVDSDGNGYTERVTNSDGSESFLRVSGGSDGADRPTSSGYAINADGLRRDWTTGPNGWTNGTVTGADGSDQGAFTIRPDGTVVFQAGPTVLRDLGLDSRTITITPDGTATTVDHLATGGEAVTHATQYGELPWQPVITPQKGPQQLGTVATAIGSAIWHPFGVIGDEILNGFYGQPSQLMTNPTVPYQPPPDRQHSPAEVGLAAAEILTMLTPLPKGWGALGRAGEDAGALAGASRIPDPAIGVPQSLPTSTLANPQWHNIYTAPPIPPRSPLDIAVNPKTPDLKQLNRRVGNSPTQNAFVQKRIQELARAGAYDFRVNQQQLDQFGNRVGINRPDLQYTYGGQRFSEEFDVPSSARGLVHLGRLLANDPSLIVGLFTVA